MSFEGVTVNKLNGGLGRSNPADDNVFALCYAVAVAKLPPGTSHFHPVKLLQVRDAEQIGFTESFDANSNVLVHHTITEFFRLAPDAVLYLILCPDQLTHTTIVQNPLFVTALRETPDVKGFAIANTLTTVSTIAEEVEPVQSVLSDMAAAHRLIDFVILEAKGPAAPLPIANYPDLREKKAPNVSVSIAQDPGVAGLSASYGKYADVGAVLGMLGARQVNENLGSVNILQKPSTRKGDRDYPLTDGGSRKWLTAALCDGTKVNSLSPADKRELTNKGYIYAGAYEGYGGIFFSSSPTCTEKASDYAYIENNRVWNKAARLIRSTLLVEIKGVVKKDPRTGYIRSTTISRWSSLVNAALERMVAADEISGYDVFINPKQVLSEASPLIVTARVQVDDIVHEISVDLGLTNNL
ncbi:hypothetical protein GFS24_10270 [Chitinophaga sp. SYP-B3965]|uniref:DUF2586 family protein n=1 Tax=Chitinophaga sp. SYP-B3965 TaxID=2663120 RepID=UPI0012995563|nr:DUF2586 family protein [Chitinophaga sp. SYP-B3965]MRG45502.1 hypothetical protein [Chitinophaga sp. SYP-B3965]